VLSGEETHINFKVFGMTRPGLELTTYCTQAQHANHYATDAVFAATEKLIKLRKFIFKQHTILDVNKCSC
jgi:hypothetical protein